MKFALLFLCIVWAAKAILLTFWAEYASEGYTIQGTWICFMISIAGLGIVNAIENDKT